MIGSVVKSHIKAITQTCENFIDQKMVACWRMTPTNWSYVYPPIKQILIMKIHKNRSGGNPIIQMSVIEINSFFHNRNVSKCIILSKTNVAYI